MPTCTCGCNQDLGRRAIQKHLQKRSVPRLVAAAAQAFRALGPAGVSPPRLNPAKKLRSSRRYFPSSPVPAIANCSEMGDASLEVDDGEVLPDVSVGPVVEFVDDDAAAQHAINLILADIRSGQRHSLSDNESDESDGVDDDSDGQNEGVGPDDGWQLYDDLVDYEGREHMADSSYRLSAVDMLHEDFERNVIANGTFLANFLVRI